MEFVAQAKALFVEHSFKIGVGLLIAIVLAGFVWYGMARSSKGSGSGSNVLVNEARVNAATTDVPNDANQPDPMAPQEQAPMPTQEELEKQLSAMNTSAPANSTE